MTTLTALRREPTTHTSLEDLATELARMQETKRDYLVDTRRAGFSTTKGVGANLTAEGAGSFLSFDPPGAEPLVTGKVNDYAHGQIAQRLGIPKKYYDRLRQEAPGLLDTNVEHWFLAKPERRLIRMLDGNVRAFLSDRFRRLDNYDLMERAVIPALRDIEGLRFHVANLTPERMVLRAVLPTVQREVGLKVGDIVQAGFQFRNSEVGASALTVEPFVWKLDCLNGMVSNAASLRAYHVGRVIDDSEESRISFANDTLAAADKATFLKCRDAITQAVSETVLDEIVEQIRAAADDTLTVRHPATATEALAQTFDLNDGERDSVLMSLARGNDFTKWGMVNAVTDAAKEAETFARQEEIERIGGQLLTLPTGSWRNIAVAA
jgi:hypothetical protein